MCSGARGACTGGFGLAFGSHLPRDSYARESRLIDIWLRWAESQFRGMRSLPGRMGMKEWAKS
jgi:hypothetical protein